VLEKTYVYVEEVGHLDDFVYGRGVWEREWEDEKSLT
jgi:hypothetical protein